MDQAAVRALEEFAAACALEGIYSADMRESNEDEVLCPPRDTWFEHYARRGWVYGKQARKLLSEGAWALY